MVEMAVADRDGMEPIAYLEALADDPEVHLEKGSLNFLAQRYGQDPSYTDYYQKSGLDVVPDVIDSQLSGKGTDFTTATPDQIAQAVTELETLAAQQETANQEAHQAQGDTSEPTAQAATDVPDDQALAELAAALGEDATAEITRSKAELFAYITQHLWAEVRVELEAEVQAQVAEQQFTSVEEAKSAAYEPAYNAMMAAIQGLWDAGAEEGGFAPLLSRPRS